MAQFIEELRCLNLIELEVEKLALQSVWQHRIFPVCVISNFLLILLQPSKGFLVIVYSRKDSITLVFLDGLSPQSSNSFCESCSS